MTTPTYQPHILNNSEKPPVAQYTPGPWEVCNRADGGLNIVTIDGDLIAEMPSSPAIEKEEANAKFIASAPDMLKALIEIEKLSNMSGGIRKEEADTINLLTRCAVVLAIGGQGVIQPVIMERDTLKAKLADALFDGEQAAQCADKAEALNTELIHALKEALKSLEYSKQVIGDIPEKSTFNETITLIRVSLTHAKNVQ